MRRAMRIAVRCAGIAARRRDWEDCPHETHRHSGRLRADQATADYYRRLNAAVNARLGGWNTAELLINSMNFQFVTDCIRQERWDDVGGYLAERALALQEAGCDLLLCVSNTLHRMAPVFIAGLSIPFLHIVDPTAKAIQADGLTRVALFGTKPVMATDFLGLHYAERFGVEIPQPTPDGSRTPLTASSSTNCARAASPKRRAPSIWVSPTCMHVAGAEGLILGCTEIPLLIAQKDRPDFPMFDTVGLHVEAAVAFALG